MEELKIESNVENIGRFPCGAGVTAGYPLVGAAGTGFATLRLPNAARIAPILNFS